MANSLAQSDFIVETYACMIPSLCLHDSEKLQKRKLSRFKWNLWLNH